MLFSRSAILGGAVLLGGCFLVWDPARLPPTLPLAINAGGAAVAPFAADAYFSGGDVATNWTGAIDTTGAPSAAPQEVYQTERYGRFTYTVFGLMAATYVVRLHFCENYAPASTVRRFDVAINGTSVLTSFDILGTAGAMHRANVQEFTVAASPGGQIVIDFIPVANQALVNGIEVLAL